MSYNTMAQMRMDPRLNSRIQSCVIQQASTAEEADEFTDEIKLNAMTVGVLFMTLMHIDEAMADAYEAEGEDSVTDEMILDGVTTNWDEVERLWRQQSGLPPIDEGEPEPEPPIVPAVDSVTPTSGGKGTTITLTGTALTGATDVTIGGKNCTAEVVVDDNTVTAVTPAGAGAASPPAGTYPLMVTVDGTVLTGPQFTVT